jgi:hypothetical protein
MGVASFPWQRFWYRRGSEPDLDSDGFLLAFETPGERRAFAPSLIHSTDTTEFDCVVFLGEPSSGKSRTVGVDGLDRAEIESAVAERGNLAAWIDLRECDSGEVFKSAISLNPIVKRWRSDDKNLLYLFLDSLDECRVSIPTISNLIVATIREFPLDRLKLRIICRTAEWPSFLELELQRLYKQQIATFQLAPLRALDVKYALETLGVEPTAFFAKVRQLNASPFARKPPTLISLARTFKNGNELPIESRII